MKRKNLKSKCLGLWLLGVFALWTVLVSCVDVQAVGPLESEVGFAAMNLLVHERTGVHLSLYVLTDWLGLVPIGFMMSFGCLGLAQWIRRKHITKVDSSILVLGGFYLVVLAVYGFFEVVVVNYRPVLLEGILEVSYPSSTTVLVLCVIPTAIMQLRGRIRNRTVKGTITWLLAAFAVFMVVGRFLSGVHWFSDIIGGILLSAGLVLIYHSITDMEPA